MSWAKEKKRIHLSRLWARITRTSHLPDESTLCDSCGHRGHVLCWDTDLSPSEVSPVVELHDAALRVMGEAA